MLKLEIKLFLVWISDMYHALLVKIYCQKHIVSEIIAYPKIYFRIIRVTSPLWQLYINQKFQKYISVSVYHCYKAPFMISLFIAYKNDECYFMVFIGSPLLIARIISFNFSFSSLFFLFFVNLLHTEVLR